MERPRINNPHDSLVRRFLHDPELMADLLRYGPQKVADQKMVELLDLTKLACKDPVTITERLAEMRGDLRFSAAFKGSERESNVYLLFEHQSSVSSNFRLRGLKYIILEYDKFWELTQGREKFPYPIVLLLCHGDDQYEHVPEMDDQIEIVPGMKTGLLDYLIIVVNITPWLREQFRGHPALQVALELLQLGSKQEVAAHFMRVIERLLPVRNDPRMDNWLPSFGLYAMEVDNVDIEQVEEAFSQIVNREEAHRMSMTTAEKLRLQGEARGKIETGRALVLRALRTKFKTVPEDIERAINQKNDPIVLESLVEQVIMSSSLEDFAEGL